MSAMSDMTKRSIWLLALAILFVGHTQLTSADAPQWELGYCDISCAGNNRVYDCDFYDQSGHSACDLGECYLEGYCCDDVVTAGDGADGICYNLSWGTAGHGAYWSWASGCSTNIESQQTSCGSGDYRRVAYAQMYCSFHDPVACP